MASWWRSVRQISQAQVATGRCTVHTLIALLLAVVPVLPLRAQETSAPAKRLVVAVLGLENQTGDPNLAHCRYAAGLLSRSLGDVKALRIASRGAIQYAFHQAGLQAGDPIDPKHARAIGECIEAQRVLWGRYSQKANLWQVHLRLMNVATGALSSEFSAEAGDWFDVRDKLTEQILAELGITPSVDEKKKAMERWTRSAEALDWCFQAQLSQDQGKLFTDLERLIRKAIAADPNCASAYSNLATALVSQGKFEAAQEALEKSLQLKPESAQARALLGWMYLTQQQFEPAEAELRRAYQRDGNDVKSLTCLAVACVQNGKGDEALRLWERAVSLDRTDAEVHAHLANAYATRKRPEDALRELEEARRYLSPGIPAGNALLMMGDAYRALGRGSEAIESYERALATAQGLGVNPTMLRYVQQRIESAKSLLAPTFIQASLPKRYSEQELDEVVREKLTEVERPLAGHPFLCTDAMKQWAQEITRGADTDLDKARALFSELSSRYDTSGQFKSRVAQEVFDAWKKPEIRLVCMDKAVLFVALARAVNVNAFFVHVTKLADGKVINHACAGVFLENRALLVDPAQHWFGIPHQQYTILDDLHATAFLCFNNREGDSAQLAAYRVGVKLWPDSRQARVLLADALYATGEESEARRVFAEIPVPESQDWEAAIYWALAGRSETVEQHWEQATDRLLKSLSICPDQGSVHFNLARIYARQHRLADARAEFRACLRCAPTQDIAKTARGAIALINEEIGSDVPPGAAASEQKPQ